MPALERKLRLLALQRLLLPAPELPRGLRAAHGSLARVLQRLARSDAATLLQAVGDVDVLVPLLCAHSGQRPLGDMLERAVPRLLLQLAQQLGGLPEAVLWDRPIASLRVGDGLLRFTPPARGVLADPSVLEVRTATGERLQLPQLEARKRSFFSLAMGELATHDNNPLSALEEHPDKHGNAIDLGGRDSHAWTSAMNEALDLIRLALPNLYRELAITLKQLVPVGFEPERHLSASYREAVGVVYLSLHPSPLTLAEAIVHETQHGKLNALSWFDPVLENGDSCWTESPVRPDLRPLRGVLMAVHAFVPVAALHLQLATIGHPLAASPTFRERREQVLSSNSTGIDTLHQLAKPTNLGKQLLEALGQLHAHTLAAQSPVPNAAHSELVG